MNSLLILIHFFCFIIHQVEYHEYVHILPRNLNTNYEALISILLQFR